MKELGVKSYRFSISWPRVIPNGGKDDPVNEQGLQFYSDVIDECLRLGIVPFVVSHPGPTDPCVTLATGRPCCVLAML